MLFKTMHIALTGQFHMQRTTSTNQVRSLSLLCVAIFVYLFSSLCFTERFLREEPYQTTTTNFIGTHAEAQLFTFNPFLKDSPICKR